MAIPALGLGSLFFFFPTRVDGCLSLGPQGKTVYNIERVVHGRFPISFQPDMLPHWTVLEEAFLHYRPFLHCWPF